jgi:uncharacterized phage infection (PIP) family protein YhgE
MSSLDQVYVLVANELKMHLKKKPSGAFQAHDLENIDNFLVDARRQLRIWQREKQLLENKIIQREERLNLRKEELQTAKKAKNDKIVEKVKTVINTLKADIKEFEQDSKKLNSCSDSITKGLDKLEEQAQKLREEQSVHINGAQQKINDLIVDFDKMDIS